jgi:hypothetical protein
MDDEDWNSSETRIIQRLSEHVGVDGGRNLTLLVINGSAEDSEVRLPVWESVLTFEELWDSALEVPGAERTTLPVGYNVAISECSVKLFRAVPL